MTKPARAIKPIVHADMDCLAAARAPAGMFGTSIEDQRRAWAYYTERLNQPPPADMKVWDEVVPATEFNVPVRIYRPADADAKTLRQCSTCMAAAS